MFDYHVHSALSFDAQSGMEECAVAAAQKGLSEVCFTEHYEVDYPYADVHPCLDFDCYFEEVARVRAAVPQITVRTGVEVGFIPESADSIAAGLLGRSFDFVLLSQHVVRGKDPWYGDYFEGKTLRAGQRLYLEEILKGVQAFDVFDCVAHIGYLDKYLHFCMETEKKPFRYEDFPELIDEILKTVIDKEKGIEINTSNYRVHGYPTPHPGIIKRFLQLGGEVLSVGSDAHSADAIGYRIAEAYELLKACGAKYVCRFAERKPQFEKL